MVQAWRTESGRNIDYRRHRTRTRDSEFEGVVVDEAFRIEDRDWLPVLFNLVQEEGLCLGGSSALNVLGAMQLARKLGPGKTIVTVLCDYGNRYMGRLFNPEFLRANNLPTPPWLDIAPTIAPV